MCNFGVGMVEPTYRRKKGERVGRGGRVMRSEEWKEEKEEGREGRVEGE